MEPNPTANRSPQPVAVRRTLRLRVSGAAVGSVLLLGGCGAAEVAQQQVEQAVDAVGESAAAQAENLLDEALSTLPGAQAQVSEQNSAAFAELRTDLEQVNAQASTCWPRRRTSARPRWNRCRSNSPRCRPRCSSGPQR